MCSLQGLDSTTAMHLLQLLRQLSQGGRAIVTTIHQPSSRLYQQLDKLLLLSQVSQLALSSAGQSLCLMLSLAIIQYDYYPSLRVLACAFVAMAISIC